MRKILSLFVVASLALTMAACTKANPTPTPTVAVTPTRVAPPATLAEGVFHDKMRQLWFEHVAYTRLAIVEFIAEPQPNERFNATASRLLRNQEDIGGSINPYYGETNGARLTGLLKAHIAGAVAVLTAAKANNQGALSAAVTAWRINGNQIADFLSNADPVHWPQQAMRDAMQIHLSQLISEITFELQKRFGDSLTAYDASQNHIAHLADTLSNGIILKFRDKF